MLLTNLHRKAASKISSCQIEVILGTWSTKLTMPNAEVDEAEIRGNYPKTTGMCQKTETTMSKLCLCTPKIPIVGLIALCKIKICGFFVFDKLVRVVGVLQVHVDRLIPEQA